MTGAARGIGGAQVTRVYETDEVGVLFVQECVRLNRIRGALPPIGIARLYVRCLCSRRVRIAEVAINTTELHGRIGVHRLNAGMTRDTALALAISFSLTLAEKIGLLGV
jgi:hypothetical protein